MAITQPAADRETAIETTALWFGPVERRAMGWLTRPSGELPAYAVLVLPPTGYPYWCSHRALRALSERIAALGHTVLRIDYDGTGDSAGDQWDPDRLQAWRATVLHAAAALRDAGAVRLTLVGARLGATLALLTADELNADRVVVWLPVVRGRRYTKEIKLLSSEVPPELEPNGAGGSRVVAGNVFTEQTIAQLGRISLTELDVLPAAAVLVIDDQEGSAGAVTQRLTDLGGEVEQLTIADAGEVLETPPEYMHPYGNVVNAVTGWLGPAPVQASQLRPLESGPTAAFAWRGQTVREEVIRVGDRGRAAIVTHPQQHDPEAATLVLLNPGSETHVGPGRAWVELARDLATAGHQAIRVDFVGWGESPGAIASPGRPYDPACVADTIEIVHALRADGYRRLAICGLCASAWIALQAACETPVDGVIAINPQLYWKQGDPVEIDWDLIRARRADQIQRIEQGARKHLWTVLDVLGERPRVRRWLDRLVGSDAVVELIFAEGDDGLKYLRERFGRRLLKLTAAGEIGLQVLAEIDHPMHLTWLRARVVDALVASLERIDSSRAA